MSEIICWKLMAIRADGRLRSPWAPVYTMWETPVLRADHFDRGAKVACARGVHAVRYGARAALEDRDYAIARCEVPPGTHAVMSPWAIRAERLLITGLRFCSLDRLPRDCPTRHAIEAAMSYWRRHVDILPPLPGDGGAYMSPRNAEPTYFSLTGGWTLTPGTITSKDIDGLLLLRACEDRDGAPAWYARRHVFCERLMEYGGRVETTPTRIARQWRELLVELAERGQWPDDVTWGWRQFLAGIELGVYCGIHQA